MDVFCYEQINNRSLQDMHIFGDPSHIPIIIVERVVNAPLHSISEHAYFSHVDQKYNPGSLMGSGSGVGKKTAGKISLQSNRVLKIVVFVHGFQVCVHFHICNVICSFNTGLIILLGCSLV